MEVILWGVRGSIPNPTKHNQFYGSNTSCVEVRPVPDMLLIFDAGTGIRSLSKNLPESGECHIFITHAHSDHVQGLSFFAPFFNPKWTINLYLPHYLPQLPYHLFDGNSFPVSFANLTANIKIHTMEPDSIVELVTDAGKATVEAMSANHPGGGFAYKVRSADSTVLISGDHEITNDPKTLAQTERMLNGTDLAIVDATFIQSDFQPGWGHSTWDDWIETAEKANVGTLILSHHMQDRSDAEIDKLQSAAIARAPHNPKKPMQISAAREEMRIILPGPVELDIKSSDWLQAFLDTLAEYREETVLLDRILSKTREIGHADAGSIYLVEGDELVFAYSQNDTLFPNSSANKSMYVNMRMPITEQSIAGYVAATGRILNLADVHNLPEGMPFKFNAGFDIKNNYTTKSVLTLPLGSGEHKILGVLQLINSKAPRTDEVIPFSDTLVDAIKILAREAASHLEVSYQVYQSVDRLLHIAMLHDPSETGPHAERVGAIAAEVYNHWATQKRVPVEQLRSYKGQLRLAAMVHDIGKVGISNAILKKPGKLTDEEFDIMKTHTILGSELFTVNSRDIAEMSHEISLHHHQKWNGRGYPRINDTTPAGEDIPLSARITAIADVFDALVSPRCYKEPWSMERATNLLKEEAGQHFDPELVESFCDVLDVVKMIYERYPDEKLPPKPEEAAS